jgi:hypothetical protein
MPGDIEPDVARIIGEALSEGLEPDVVAEDLTTGDRAKLLFRKGEPVGGFNGARDVECEIRLEEPRRGHDRDSVVDRAGVSLVEQLRAVVRWIGRSEAGWISPEPVREAVTKRRVDRRSDFEIVRVEQQIDTRSPVMIGAHLGVEAEHFRSGAEPRGGVSQARECAGEDRPHRLIEEQTTEVESPHHRRIASLGNTDVTDVTDDGTSHERPISREWHQERRGGNGFT